MKRNELKKYKNRIIKVEIDKTQLRVLVRLYKEGLSLFELTTLFGIDFLSIIEIIKKAKIKKKSLYRIYEKQQDRNEQANLKKTLTEREQYEIEKYFPECNTDITFSFFIYWSNKQKERLEEKSKCIHKVRNMTCANCGKILRDASDIPIDPYAKY